MTHRKNSRRGFTAVEAVLVIVVLAIVVGVTMWQVDKRRQARLRAEVDEDFHYLLMPLIDQLPEWEVMKDMSEDEARTLQFTPSLSWPKLSSTPGQLAVAEDTYHVTMLEERAEFETGIDMVGRELEAMKLVTFTDAHYWYLGYEVQTEEAGLAFVEAYRKAVEKTGEPPSGDELQVTPFDEDTGTSISSLHRLGTRDDYTLDIAVRTPLFIQRPGIVRGGSYVFFLGGAEPEFIPYPGKWPMTEKFIEALESLDELKLKEPNGDAIEQ